MNGIEIFMSVGSVAIAVAGLTYVAHIVRVSGRDRPHDPARLRHLIDTAPMERLDNVLAK